MKTFGQAYKSLGFIRYRQSYKRICNDVLQSIVFSRSRSGRECSVEYGICPLCYKMEFPYDGTHDIKKIALLDSNIIGEYNPQDDQSIKKCLEGIFKYIDRDIIPFFDSAKDCNTAFIQNLALSKKEWFIRSQWVIRKRGCLTWNWEKKWNAESLLCDYESRYMALKSGQFDYALQSFHSLLERDQISHDLAIEKRNSTKDTWEQSFFHHYIQNMEKHIFEHKQWIQMLEANDINRINGILSDNEINTVIMLKNHMPKLIVP